MLKLLVFAVALTSQPHKAEKPMALDPITQGRVHAAYRDARAWSFKLANQLCFRNPMVPLRMDPRQRSESTYKYTLYKLESAAAKQICDAYGISRKTLSKVISDPRSQDIEFIPELKAEDRREGIVMATSHSSRGTRFDPRKVVLPASIAKRIGYKNPKPIDPNAPPTPPAPHADSYTNDGRLIPGMPRDPEIERRKREIEERASQTVIKDPIPM